MAGGFAEAEPLKTPRKVYLVIVIASLGSALGAVAVSGHAKRGGPWAASVPLAEINLFVGPHGVLSADTEVSESLSSLST